MATITNYIGVWLSGSVPSDPDLIAGTGAVAHTTVQSDSGADVSEIFDGLESDTDYSIEWLSEDIDGDTVRAASTPFTTLESLAPIAPADISTTSQIGVEVLYNVSSLWENASPDGFSVTGLPPGLSMTNAGVVSGTPDTLGDYTTVVTNTNLDGSDDWNVSWAVIEAPEAPDPSGANLQLQLQLRG